MEDLAQQRPSFERDQEVSPLRHRYIIHSQPAINILLARCSQIIPDPDDSNIIQVNGHRRLSPGAVRNFIQRMAQTPVKAEKMYELYEKDLDTLILLINATGAWTVEQHLLHLAVCEWTTLTTVQYAAAYLRVKQRGELKKLCLNPLLMLTMRYAMPQLDCLAAVVGLPGLTRNFFTHTSLLDVAVTSRWRYGSIPPPSAIYDSLNAASDHIALLEVKTQVS